MLNTLVTCRNRAVGIEPLTCSPPVRSNPAVRIWVRTKERSDQPRMNGWSYKDISLDVSGGERER